MDDFKCSNTETFNCTVFIAGDIDVAKQFCREYFYNTGWCCTIEPTTYIYTGGEEEGIRIGFINYARFPIDSKQLQLERVTKFSEQLAKKLCQKSLSIVTTDKTYYIELMEKK